MIEKLNELLSSNIIFSLMMLFAAYVIGVVIYLIAMFLLKGWQKSDKLNKFKIKPSHIRAPLFLLLPAICVMFILPVLRFSEDIKYVISHIVSPWLIISIGWFLIGLVNAARETFLSHYDVTVKDNLQARRIYTQTRVIENVIDVIIVVLTVALVLMTFPHL